MSSGGGSWILLAGPAGGIGHGLLKLWTLPTVEVEGDGAVPAGVPSPSRTTVPDAGSADVAVMPASCRAAELATPTWPPR